MKLIEALKQLKVVEKRMDSNSIKITKYSSIVSTERPAFENEEVQKTELKALTQANKDLLKIYLILKNKIDKTNLTITVSIDGVEYTINELLVLKRRLIQKMINTYQALNEEEAYDRFRKFASNDKEAKIVRLYNEKDKNENLNFWQNLRDNIDSRLEVINATTDVIE